MRIVIRPKKKWLTRKITKKGAVSGDGDKGSKYRKKHLLAYGLPGTPNGVCIGKEGKNKECNCGGHSAK